MHRLTMRLFRLTMRLYRLTMLMLTFSSFCIVSTAYLLKRLFLACVVCLNSVVER